MSQYPHQVFHDAPYPEAPQDQQNLPPRPQEPAPSLLKIQGLFLLLVLLGTLPIMMFYGIAKSIHGRASTPDENILLIGLGIPWILAALTCLLLWMRSKIGLYLGTVLVALSCIVALALLLSLSPPLMLIGGLWIYAAVHWFKLAYRPEIQASLS